jgi:putative tryptophan/tyrosine transport system substrate-binding protein
VNNKLIWLLIQALLLPAPCAQAQQPGKVPRIGFLIASSPSAIATRMDAFRQGLRELGYVEGKDIVIEWRSAEGKFDRLPVLAAELVRLKVDVIVTAGPTVTRPVKEVTSTVPIVMAQDTDPVASGFVASLARPGGNITGLVSDSCPGDERKTTGALEGDRSHTFTLGPHWEFDQPW